VAEERGCEQVIGGATEDQAMEDVIDSQAKDGALQKAMVRAILEYGLTV